MRTRAKTVLGIDIGARRISAALVEKTEQGVKVVASATGDLPVDESKKQPASPGKVLSRVLRQLGRRARARGIRAAVAMSTDSVVMRLLDLPKQMPTNISEFVDGELKQYVALSGRSMSSDFCGIGGGSGARKRLLAVAADAAEVEETFRTCSVAGVTVGSVEPVALASVRALLTEEKDLRRDHAVVAMLSGRNLVVCLFCKGILDFVRIRDLPLGMDTPASLCTWLAEELDAVLRYYHAETPGESPEWQARLVVHDAAYGKEEIASLLARKPGVKAFVVVGCGEHRETSSEAGAAALAASSGMAVGAALKLLDVEGDELRIDLTPQEVTRARLSSRRGWITANAAAVVFLGVFLLVQLLAKTTDAMNQRITQTRVSEQLYTMPALVMEDRYIDAEILRMERQLTGLEAVRARRDVDWPTVLSTIAQAAPTTVCITHLACSDSESLSLKGLAMSAAGAKAFVQHLDGTPPFKSVRLTRLQRRQAGAEVMEYEIICALKPINQGHDGDQGS